MYQNNIAERSSSRVLQRPGGAQSINIFGGGDAEPEQRRTGKRAITPNIGSVAQAAPVAPSPAADTAAAAAAEPSKPVVVEAPAVPAASAALTAEATTAPEAATAGASATKSSPRVNNIWGSDAVAERSSTRVLRGPGGGSSGVAGALGGGGPVESPAARSAGVNRNNQTSASSPFSSEPEPQRGNSGTRIRQAPGGASNGNILSWGH